MSHYDTERLEAMAEYYPRTKTDCPLEQPMPTEGKGEPIVDLVKQDLDGRLAKGLKTYGEPLRAHNGRDALLDALEEVYDLACYLKQAHIEITKKQENICQALALIVEHPHQEKDVNANLVLLLQQT